MHDLVHDLARAILAHQVNDEGNDGGNRCRYALLADCTKPLQLSVTSANLKALHFLDCGNLELRGDAFSLATSLHVLDLSGCFIHELPDSVGQLKQLRYLHAPRIQDWTIPNCITGLSKLNYLNLRGSINIFELPESFGDMKGLMHLDLSGCIVICELPKSFAELKQLVHLDLSDCCMSISETFGGFTKLQYLNLSFQLTIDVKNRIGLSNVIGNLIKLRYLNLSGCMKVMASSDQIDSLLDSICTLCNLEHLDLSKNIEISSVTESIGNLKKLHTLDLSHCINLEKLPDNMVKLVSLKVLNVDKKVILDESVLSLLNIVLLPRFVVHASSAKCSSNIIRLQLTNPVKLEIDRLENVMFAEEAQSIKLIEKQKIKELKFQWTVAAGRFVDDKEVLEKLVPPSSVKELYMKGYMSANFPDWFMDIRHHVPNLSKMDLWDISNCTNLPPVGQLPNLEFLHLRGMESLEEWNPSYTSGKEGANELLFPKLEMLRIEHCAKLTIKPCLPARGTFFVIVDCDNVLSSWGESPSHSGASSSYPIISLSVEKSKVPLHQWRLLHQLPALCSLTISCCSDLTASPEIIQQLSSLESLTLVLADQAELPRWVVELTSLQELKLLGCRSVTSLPKWLGELASLKKLDIMGREGIMSLPDSITQLTKMEYLLIGDCPSLKEWCESEENKTKLTHITEKSIWYAKAHEEYIAKTFLETTNNLHTACSSSSSRIEVSDEATHSDHLHSTVMTYLASPRKHCLLDNNAHGSASLHI